MDDLSSFASRCPRYYSRVIKFAIADINSQFLLLRRGRLLRRGGSMAKTVSCRDVGADCDFVARGNSEDEIMQTLSEHARTDHQMSEIPTELAARARAAIHDEAA